MWYCGIPRNRREFLSFSRISVRISNISLLWKEIMLSNPLIAEEKLPIASKGLTSQEAKEKLRLLGPNITKQLLETRASMSNTCCPCFISSKAIQLLDLLEAMETKFEKETRCLRDGQWVMVLTETLVRGDVISTKRNTTLPADCILPVPVSSNLSHFTHYYHDTSMQTGETARVETFEVLTKKYSTLDSSKEIPGVLFYRCSSFLGLGDCEEAFDYFVQQQHIAFSNEQIERIERSPSSDVMKIHLAEIYASKKIAEEKLRVHTKEFYESHTADEVVMIVVRTGCEETDRFIEKST